jgi:two-component system cell cycle response regulator DivK
MPAARGRRATNTPEISRTNPATILIAEDHLDSRDALSALLQAFGYGVLLAVNGVEAVQVAATSRPDIILMDMMMPEMDGFEATRRLRHRTETRAIPIIAVTAMEGARELALQAGADDFVGKPVDSRVLLDKIRDLLGGALD